MFNQITRSLNLMVVALVALTLVGCSAGDEGGEPEQLRSVQQHQDTTVTCTCLNPQGEEDRVECYDTCFKTVSCGEKDEMCGTVCKYQDPGADPGDKCEFYDPKGDTISGVCARGGIGPAGRAGCCAACMDKDYICGGLSDPKACGAAGNECVACDDKSPNDCKVPVCKEGKCDEGNAPVGQGCSVTAGSGKCAAGGVCCTGCITPGGACQPGNVAGSCGRAGDQCMNCDDGKACNGAEKCDAGSCQAGTPLQCNDNDPCTKDSCSNAAGCQYEIDSGAMCNDGNGCTVEDKCSSTGKCEGTPMVCDNGNECMIGTCSQGACQFMADPNKEGDACDDGSSCTTGETCQSGVCMADAADVCHDTYNPCVTSSCGADGMSTCTQVNKPDDTPCDDGNPCTADDVCQAGACQGGGGIDCDDNNVCTDDTCDPSVGCAHENVSGECADGDLCTEGDHCVDGACEGNPVECPATNECTSEGQCDADSGLCSILLLEDGTECGNGGECDGGQCTGEEMPPDGAGGTGGSGTGGTANEAGAAGAAGDSASGGTSSGGTSAGGTSAGGSSVGGAGGSGGAGGAGGTYSGDSYTRDPQGCDCRTAPGGTAPGGSGLGLLGLCALFGVGLRRRRRFGARLAS